jgi:PAS domain S-box-containing protein
MQDSKLLKRIPEPERMEVIKRYQILDTPRLAIEAANVGTWIIDEATRVFITSARVKELFDHQPDEELSFESALLRISDKYREKVLQGIEEAFTQRKPYHMDFSISRANKARPRWVKAMGGYYHDDDGILSHISGVMMDITLQKEKELRKNKLIGMVSHELKTPLTSLKAYVQMLNAWAKKQKDVFVAGTLSKVEKQVKKMTSMINGFLSLAQVESGKIHLTLQDFDINELIREAMEEMLLLNPTAAITFQPKGVLMLNGDRDKIDQVLINFLSNAIKYSPEGGMIEINTRLIDNMVEVSVADQGLGIAQQDIEKLFNRYYRVENKHTEKIPGFGIGLYLCAEIISHHHGKISVQSEQGKGSTFSFTIPLKTA